MTRKVDHLMFTSWKNGSSFCGLRLEDFMTGEVGAHLPIELFSDSETIKWTMRNVKCEACQEALISSLMG